MQTLTATHANGHVRFITGQPAIIKIYRDLWSVIFPDAVLSVTTAYAL